MEVKWFDIKSFLLRLLKPFPIHCCSAIFSFLDWSRIDPVGLFALKFDGKLFAFHTIRRTMPASRKPPTLGCLSNHVGFHLRLAQLAVFKHFEGRLGEIDVTPAIFSVLEVLHQNDGITQSKLAAAVQLDRSSVVPLLDKLAKRGLVERQASTTDRRHNHLHLTEAGHELLAEAHRRAETHEKEICKPLTAAEKKMLLELLGRLRG